MAPTYGVEDIKVIRPDQTHDMIRRRADMYAGEKPHGRTLAIRLAEDLLIEAAGPVKIDQVDRWWIVSANRDWLPRADGEVSLNAFSTVVHYPPRGLNAMRHEVVIAALSDAVVTVGSEGTTWIVGSSSKWPLPMSMSLDAPGSDAGRVVAFTIDDE